MSSNFAEAPFGEAYAAANAARRRAAVESPLMNARKRADRACALVNWILLAGALGIGWHFDALTPVLVVGLPLALVSTLLALALPGHKIARMGSALTFMGGAALLIDVGGGQDEFHFVVFILLSLLLAYRDVQVVLLATGFISVQQLAFNYFQAWGWPVRVFAQTGFDVVAQHWAFLWLQTLFIAAISARQERDANIAGELAAMSEGIGQASGYITLSEQARPASDVAGAFHATLAAVRKTLLQVRDSVSEVSESVAGTSARNAVLSERTGQQRRSLEGMVAAMEQLKQSVHESVDHAMTASALAGSASEVATQGRGAIKAVIETMGDIYRSCERITDIIGVIDGIAFQTNILALNASVEAARAGDQGRGFGVVAEEVRTLAQRSASAAKEIRVLIGESVDRARTGNGLVESAGNTVGEVLESVTRLSAIVHEMATASGAQRAGIDQMGENIAGIDAAIRENAAHVADTVEQVRQQHRQTELLASAVKVFRLD
ncbi:methyl-accepting chemotaxis protein [Paraburkholderia sp. CNPSo 3076]|uniref:methyl-accepting chemotaxis protein n=2 Tax=unclassified Paraburkholderia TaxID=2615204 RepID=UPI0022510E2F|nr:methyl-accepting chemotaxis protein [Paraburkholderia sp. CNPSo 3076]MCX5538648.1 methyl-accepting chemotaxis protein [Paraburkholderia sp. CNPSo 3076]